MIAVIAIIIPAILFVPDLFTSTSTVIHHLTHIGNGYIPRTPRIHIIPRPVVPRIVPRIVPRLYTVRNGDTLWTIALKLYGNGLGYSRLYHLNMRAVGSNPNIIHTGLVLKY